MKTDFLTQLPILLRLLADPRTPHTVSELWCRVFSYGWEECEPILLAELQSGEADVQQLVIEIIGEQAENSGIESIQPFLTPIVSLLSHEDSLVRMSVISAVGELMIDDETTQDAIRQIIRNDEPIIASAALQILLRFNPRYIGEVVSLFQDNSD